MKQVLTLIFLVIGSSLVAQTDSTTQYKKRVLETTEIDFLSSYYTQDGTNAAVTGGIGTEELSDFASDITISIPLNDDDILAIDASVSAYSSASSSNLDPLDRMGASGSPWVQSSGASQSDIWISVNTSFSHSSDDRNSIWSTNLSFAREYDYNSIGFGGSYSKLFNEKNTEVGIKANVYLDKWSPKYPTELDSYFGAGQNLNNGFFQNIDIFNQNGTVIDKNGANRWSPFQSNQLPTTQRNTYSMSLSFSQILSRNAQLSFFLDLVSQRGWLANPMQRVYFSDRDNYYVGEAASIDNYTSPSNTGVFQLSDDIERLPEIRFKVPIGARFNYYINQNFVFRAYYRYYFDDWGVNSQTFNIEVPIKITDKFTLYPTYRYYNQSAADYFAPFEEHISNSDFYTSDYDLSKFSSNQYGFGVSYTDIFTKFHLGNLGLKNLDLKYNTYDRSTGLKASIVTFGAKFIIDK